MNRQFTCGRCGNTYTKGRSDEEALAEFKLHFPTYPEAEMSIICEDCYNSIIAEPDHANLH